LAPSAAEDETLLSSTPLPRATVHEADGLDWLLRLAALWQQVAAVPLRRTQGGDFFKRDADRLAGDPLLNAPLAEHLAEVPGPGFLMTVLAESVGIVQAADGEVRARELPACWDEGLLPALASLWAALPLLESWNALDGWRGGVPPTGNPFPS